MYYLQGNFIKICRDWFHVPENKTKDYHLLYLVSTNVVNKITPVWNGWNKTAYKEIKYQAL